MHVQWKIFAFASNTKDHFFTIDSLTNALLLIKFRTAKAFPESLCSANLALRFSRNPTLTFDRVLFDFS